MGVPYSEGKWFKATAKMVIDASGSSSVLRKFNPIDSYIEREISTSRTWRLPAATLWSSAQGVQDETYFTPDYCLIHLRGHRAAGYAWGLPKGRTRWNIGLGVSKPGLDRRNKKLGKSDTLSRPLSTSTSRTTPASGTGGSRPTGRQGQKGNWGSARGRERLHVRNGFAVVGDAAWLPRPLKSPGEGRHDAGDDPGQGRGPRHRGERRLPGGALAVQLGIHADPHGYLRWPPSGPPQALPPDRDQRADSLWDETLPHSGGHRRDHREAPSQVQRDQQAQPRPPHEGREPDGGSPRGSATQPTRARLWCSTT